MRKLALILLLLSSVVFAQRYELKNIQFSGNKNFADADLKGVILSQKTPLWFWKFLNSFTSWGAPAEYLDTANIPLDINGIRDFYHVNGFFETKVDYSYQLDTASRTAKLMYKITEGDPATYGKVNFIGIDSVPDRIRQNFLSYIKTDSSKKFNQELFTSYISSSVTELLNNGYMMARFDSTLVVSDTAKNKADLDVFITTGNRYVIDTISTNITGEGAPDVDKDMLKKMTDIKVGDFYSAEKIRTGQARLFRSGLFSTVSLNVTNKDTISTSAPLLLEGNIGKLNELSPEIILNNQQSALNIGLGATYIKKNFFGKARKFTFQNSFGIQDLFHAQVWKLIKKFSFRDTTLLGYVDSRVTIEQPYLFGELIFGSWVTYITIDKQPSYNNTVYGTKLTFDFELPTHTLVNKLSTYYNIEESKEVYRTNRDSLSSKLLSSIGTSFARVTTDNLLFPTKGYIVAFELEEANSLPYLVSKLFNTSYPGSLFYKVTWTNSVYSMIGRDKNMIAAGKFKVGHLQAFHGDYSGIPLNRAFYAGGSNSVRGWRSNELIPKEAPFVIDLLGDKAQNVKGGTFLLEGSLEFRYRFLTSVGVVLFNDFGNTWIGYKSFKFNQIADAAGFGLRYYSAVAPFRLDFGWRVYDPSDGSSILKKPFWKSLEFHFGIGEAF